MGDSAQIDEHCSKVLQTAATCFAMSCIKRGPGSLGVEFEINTSIEGADSRGEALGSECSLTRDDGTGIASLPRLD